MVKKGWEKCGFLCSLDCDFQKEVLFDNMKTTFLKQEPSEGMEKNINNGKEEVDAKETL
jgi:hypothetical protein